MVEVPVTEDEDATGWDDDEGSGIRVTDEDEGYREVEGDDGEDVDPRDGPWFEDRLEGSDFTYK